MRLRSVGDLGPSRGRSRTGALADQQPVSSTQQVVKRVRISRLPLSAAAAPPLVSPPLVMATLNSNLPGTSRRPQATSSKPSDGETQLLTPRALFFIRSAIHAVDMYPRLPAHPPGAGAARRARSAAGFARTHHSRSVADGCQARSSRQARASDNSVCTPARHAVSTKHAHIGKANATRNIAPV